MNERITDEAKQKRKGRKVQIKGLIGAEVKNRVEKSKSKVETTRFTIDIPVELHARIKSQCALRRTKMRDEIQELLEKHFLFQR